MPILFLAIHFLAATEPSPPAFSRRVEIWIAPVTTAWAAAQGNVSLTAGVAWDLSPPWESSLTLNLLAGTFTRGYEEDTVPAWQVSIAWAMPVHRWRVPVGGPRSAFFLGPTIGIALSHNDRYPYAYALASRPVSSRDYGEASTGFAFAFGYDAGFRFQFSHFDLTLRLPSVSFAMTSNFAPQLSPFPTAFVGQEPGENVTSVGVLTDFNLLRLGIDL